jgi:hypothetical protein
MEPPGCATTGDVSIAGGGAVESAKGQVSLMPMTEGVTSGPFWGACPAQFAHTHDIFGHEHAAKVGTCESALLHTHYIANILRSFTQTALLFAKVLVGFALRVDRGCTNGRLSLCKSHGAGSYVGAFRLGRVTSCRRVLEAAASVPRYSPRMLRPTCSRNTPDPLFPSRR